MQQVPLKLLQGHNGINRKFMSGKTSDNIGRASGLVKAAATGAPDSGSSDPVITTNPSAVGDRFINTTSGELFVATDVTSDENVWKGQLGTDVEPPMQSIGSRGVWGGGDAPGALDVIDYLIIASLGNATDFGNLIAPAELAGQGMSNVTRGLFAGGDSPSAGADDDVIQYITFASTGNCTDFGNLTSGRSQGPSGVSNGTRGCWGSGDIGGSDSTIIDYITIATAGNAIDFGDVTDGRSGITSFNSKTRGVWAGGDTLGAGYTDILDYVTISSIGNAIDFGDMIAIAGAPSATSSGERGVIFGGYTSPANHNRIQYVTIATTGNATDFGDLTAGRNASSACSDGTKGLTGGGLVSGRTASIDYINIASLGNAADFGDLTAVKNDSQSCSGQ